MCMFANICVTNVAAELPLILSQSCCDDVSFGLDKLLCLNEALLGRHSGGRAKESDIRDRGTLLSPPHSRTQMVASEDSENSSVSLGPRPCSTHPPPASCSHGAVNILLTLLTHYQISTEHTGATLSSSPQQDPELVSVIVPSCCCVSTERSTRSSTPTGKSPPQMLAGPVGWPLFPSIPC